MFIVLLILLLICTLIFAVYLLLESNRIEQECYTVNTHMRTYRTRRDELDAKELEQNAATAKKILST